MSFKIFGKDSLREKLLCGFAVAMFSAVIFLYFCAQNTSEISPITAAVLSLVMFLLAVASYIPSLIIFRRAFPAMVFCVVCWLIFYLIPLFYEFFAIYWPFNRGRSILIILIMLCIASFAALKSRKIQKTTQGACMLIGVLAVIFVMNLRPLFKASSLEKSTDYNKIPVKKDFVVDNNTKSPNIYWIHADGMLNVDAVKKFFNDNQKEFLAELKERGFEINPSANFEAQHQTAIAIPTLMNPYTYDNWIREKIFSIKKDEINNYEFYFMRRNSELQYAFSAKNYALNVIGPYGFYYPMPGGNLWLISWLIGHRLNGTRGEFFSCQEIDNGFMKYAFEALNFNNVYFITVAMFILNILDFHGTHYQAQIPEDMNKKIFMNGWDASDTSLAFTDGLYDILYGNYHAPKLTIIHELTPHAPFMHATDGTILKGTDNLNPLDYYPQHVWSGKVLIGTIDMILDKDPDAVIIIQADHGVHVNDEKVLKATFGNETDPRELWNSTMSALRVPPEYKTGEEHYALETPLNMTRYLVNSFVGKNYEYLKE